MRVQYNLRIRQSELRETKFPVGCVGTSGSAFKVEALGHKCLTLAGLVIEAVPITFYCFTMRTDGQQEL